MESMASIAPTTPAMLLAVPQGQLAALLAAKAASQASSCLPQPSWPSVWLPTSVRPYNPICDAASRWLGSDEAASAPTVARAALLQLLRGRSLEEALASASAAAQAALLTEAACTALQRVVGRSRTAGALVLAPWLGSAWMMGAFPSEHAAKAAAAAALQVEAARRDPSLSRVLLAAAVELEALLVAALRVGSAFIRRKTWSGAGFLAMRSGPL